MEELIQGRNHRVTCVPLDFLETTGVYAECAHGNGGLLGVALLSHLEGCFHAALKLPDIACS